MFPAGGGVRHLMDEGLLHWVIVRIAYINPVFLKADRGVPYGDIVELIARMRRAGVSSLGLVTEPPRTGH